MSCYANRSKCCHIWYKKQHSKLNKIKSNEKDVHARDYQYDKGLYLQRIALALMYEELELYDLVYGCPNEHGINCCPSNKIDHMPFIGKAAWIESLNQDQLRAMIEQHKNSLIALWLWQ